MDKSESAVVGFVLGMVFFGCMFYLLNQDNQAYGDEARIAITECERQLPRDKKCVAVITAEVEKGE